MAVLHRISGTGNPNRVGDVIFVHGLDGHWRTTWYNGSDDGFWPEWLAKDCPDLGVWSVEYDAASSGWRGNAMPIIDRAANVLDALLNEGLGIKPLSFVTHSMGGLIIKQMLRYANDTMNSLQTYRKLVRATRGVVFLSTPHTGSDAAGLARYVSIVIRRTDAVKDMEANAASLRDLNRWYQNNTPNLSIRSKVYFEKQHTLGLRIVDESSADVNISGVEAIPIDSDHISICKPKDRDSQVYKGSQRFIEDLVPRNISAHTADRSGLLRETIDTRRLLPVYKLSGGGETILVAYVLREDPEAPNSDG